MTGQDAVNVASTFNEKVGVDGVVLTKMDGDTRGGAALSIRAVTGKPILYVGMGEKLSDLEQFYPDRMASRILGMGDILSLIDKVQAEVDEEKARDMERKLRKADFDFNDFLDQFAQLRKMGNIGDLMGMIPGMGSKMKGMEMHRLTESIKKELSLSFFPHDRTGTVTSGYHQSVPQAPHRGRRRRRGCGSQPADEAVRSVQEDDEADVRHDGQEEQERVIQSSFLIHMGIQVPSGCLTYAF